MPCPGPAVLRKVVPVLFSVASVYVGGVALARVEKVSVSPCSKAIKRTAWLVPAPVKLKVTVCVPPEQNAEAACAFCAKSIGENTPTMLNNDRQVIPARRTDSSPTNPPPFVNHLLMTNMETQCQINC